MEKIKQAEGLCLMWYKCEQCNKKERIWNSRPRVTPFMIGCSSCNGMMQHENFNLDEYAPNYQPSKGERIFIDWSKETAEIRHRKYIEQCWDHKEYPMSGMFKDKDAALKSLMDDWEFGQPTVITL